MAGTPHPLSPDETASRLRAQFGEDIVDAVDQHGHAVATVTVDRYHDVCRFLRDEPDFACDYCDFTGGGGLRSRRRASRWSRTCSRPRITTTCASR